MCPKAHRRAPVGARDRPGTGAPAGIRSLAMPFLNCLHGQRAGADTPTQQRREGGQGGRGGTGACFLTIPPPQVVSPSEVTLDMESGAPQPTLSQVLTNPSAPGGRGAPATPPPLLGCGARGGAGTPPFPWASSAKELCGGGGGWRQEPWESGICAEGLRGSRQNLHSSTPCTHSALLQARRRFRGDPVGSAR